MSIQFCVKLLSKLHRPAQHTSPTPIWPPPQHWKHLSMKKIWNCSKYGHIESCNQLKGESVSSVSGDYGPVSISFKVLVLVSVKQDKVIYVSVGHNYAVLYFISCFKSRNFLKLKNKKLFKLTNILCDNYMIKQLFVSCHSRSHGCPLRGVQLTIY